MERLETPDAEGRIVRLTVDLQQDFALDRPLSTFALAAFDLLDRIAVVRAGHGLGGRVDAGRPRQILAAQQNKARGEAVGRMKADGVGCESGRSGSRRSRTRSR
ncbi:hypothetical protein SCALM49S_04925 [Streptomyces californicus]